MSFLTKVKNAGIKAKIHGEIALMDRESKARRQEFGVQLYDLLSRLDSESSLAAGTVKTPLFLGTQSQQVKQVFDACRLDIRQLQDDRDAKDQEVEHLQVDRERARPAMSSQEKLQRAGQWVSSNSLEAKKRTEIALLDRKIKQRKEAFGLEVFELVEQSSQIAAADKKGLLGGVKSSLTNQLSKLSSNEKEIQHCIDKAKSDVESIQNGKARKEKEIQRLDAETS